MYLYRSLQHVPNLHPELQRDRTARLQRVAIHRRRSPWKRSPNEAIFAQASLVRRWEVYDYLKAGALSVVQCDPEWCGGTSELLKICTIESLFDVPVIPHGHSLHAALHLIASQSPAVCPLAEYLILKMRSYYHFEKTPPAHFALPSGPAYGIEFDESKVEKQELVRWN